MTKPKPPKPPALACSFCGLPREQVAHLLVGPVANICGACLLVGIRTLAAEVRRDRDTVTDGAGI